MPCHYNYPMPNVAALGVGARAKQITTMGLADSPIHRVLLRSPPLARVGATAVVLLARRGRKYATPPLSSHPATSGHRLLYAGNKAGISIHPSDAVRLHLADGAYVVVVWMCGRCCGVAAAAASCAITSITIFMTLSRVSRPRKGREGEPQRQRRKAIKPVSARCSPSSAPERDEGRGRRRAQPKIGLHLRVRFEVTL